MGLNKIFTIKNRGIQVILSILAILGLLIELYPVNIKPRLVKDFTLTKTEKSDVDPSRYVLIIPKKELTPAHFAYQVTSGLNMVYFDRLSREDNAAKGKRGNFAPMIYHFKNPLDDPKEYSKELSNLNVGYVLFENKNDPRRMLFNGKSVAERNPEILIELTNYQINSISIDISKYYTNKIN